MLHKPEEWEMKDWILHSFRTKNPEVLESGKQKLSQQHCGTSFWQFTHNRHVQVSSGPWTKTKRNTVVCRHPLLITHMKDHLLIMHMENKDGPQNWDRTSVLNLTFGLQMECVVPWESQDSFCSITMGFTRSAWGCLPLPPAAVEGNSVFPSCQHSAGWLECSWATKNGVGVCLWETKSSFFS